MGREARREGSEMLSMIKIVEVKKIYQLVEENMIDASKEYRFCSITPEYAILWNYVVDEKIKGVIRRLLKIKRHQRRFHL